MYLTNSTTLLLSLNTMTTSASVEEERQNNRSKSEASVIARFLIIMELGGRSGPRSIRLRLHMGEGEYYELLAIELASSRKEVIFFDMAEGLSRYCEGVLPR
jgi:hypothetical protein